MNGSGMQADIGKPVEAAEKDVGEEQTESVGGVGNVNLEESADSEESADLKEDVDSEENANSEENAYAEESADAEEITNSVEESPAMTEEDFSSDLEKKKEDLEKPTSADSDQKGNGEEAEVRKDLTGKDTTEDNRREENKSKREEDKRNIREDSGVHEDQPEQRDGKEKEEADEESPVRKIVDSNISESGKEEVDTSGSKSDETKLTESESNKPEIEDRESEGAKAAKEKNDTIPSTGSQEDLVQKQRELLTVERKKTSEAEQKEQSEAEQKEKAEAEQKEKPAAEKKEQAKAEQTKAEQTKAEQTKAEQTKAEQTESTGSETAEERNIDNTEEKSDEIVEPSQSVKIEETVTETEQQKKKIQQIQNTEKLRSVLDSAEIGISESKESGGKEKMVLRLEGAALETAQPVKVKIQLIKENGMTIGNADGKENQVLVSREIVPNYSSGKTEDAESGDQAAVKSWEMEILTGEDTGTILQKIPDNDGLYRISVTYEDEEGNTASRDIPFKVNRFGSVYVYSQSCRDLQDNYVRTVERDLVISEYNPDRLLAKSLKVEIIRDGEPLEHVLYEVRSGENEKQKEGKGWNRYDYIISQKNFEKDGIYQVSVSSADEAGNNPDSMDYYQKPILFRVDSTKPEVDFIKETARSMKVNVDNILRYQAFDAIRLKSIRVLVDGKLQEEISDIPNVTNYEGTVRLTGLRKHSVQIVLTDMAGNTYRSEEQVVHGIPVWFSWIMGISSAGAVGASLFVARIRKRKRWRLR